MLLRLFPLLLVLPTSVYADEVVAEPVVEDAESSLEAPSDDPLLLHAEALEAELDGDSARALELLRAAQAMAPKDETLAFDLARIAFESQSQTLDADVANFLSLAPLTPDSDLLRAYIHISRGDKQKALQHVRAVLAQRPADAEALRLEKQVVPPPPKRKTPSSRVWARLRTGAQLDSNVTVLPETNPSRSVGVRGLVQALAGFSHRPGALGFDIALFASMGPHLNDRANLATYDASTGTAVAGLRYRNQDLFTGGSAVASAVMIDDFGAHFMTDSGARLEGGLVLGSIDLGLYGSFGVRDFVEGNPEGEAEDRDGPRLSGGALLRWHRGQLRLRTTLGALFELAQGAEQRVNGGVLDARWSYAPGDFKLGFGLRYDLRQYAESARDRVDHRLTPSLRLAYSFTDTFVVFGSYAWMRNISKKRFDYQRHLGQLGLEVRL